MRVLTISWEYPPDLDGGLGRHVAELTPALVEQGIDMHVVTPAGTPTVRQLRTGSIEDLDTYGSSRTPASHVDVAVEKDGITVHRVYAPQKNSKDDIFSRVTAVNEVITTYLAGLVDVYPKWELIHVHDWLTGKAGLALQQAEGIPLVATIHATERGRGQGHLVDELGHAIDRADHNLIHGADRIIVCSHYMFHELQRFYQIAQEKMDIVPNGVDLTELYVPPHENLTEFRAKYAAPHERIVFTISRHVYEKGVHDVVKATPGILSRCSAARIVIAGSGPETDKLKHLAADCGVSDQISFVGRISNEERNRLYKVADCAVFASLYEPFGIVALEAMALKCPVVVSNVGGFAEVVSHQETGITIFPKDPESVAWGVSRALTHPIWARRHAIRARKAVEEKFVWSRVAKLTIDTYQRAIAAHKPVS
jgi:glycosyltransferase involved in cell wall biosynthesis